jgi:hypothetical protein
MARTKYKRSTPTVPIPVVLRIRLAIKWTALVSVSALPGVLFEVLTSHTSIADSSGMAAGILAWISVMTIVESYFRRRARLDACRCLTSGAMVQMAIVLVGLTPWGFVFLIIMYGAALLVAFPFLWLLGALFSLLPVSPSLPVWMEEFGGTMALVVLGGLPHAVLATTLGAWIRKIQLSRSRRARLVELTARLRKPRDRSA